MNSVLEFILNNPHYRIGFAFDEPGRCIKLTMERTINNRLLEAIRYINPMHANSCKFDVLVSELGKMRDDIQLYIDEDKD